MDRPPIPTDQPLVPLARRRTGVKNGGGTARDVVSFLARSRPRISLTPGAGLPRGRSLSLRARGVRFLRSPPGSPRGTTSQAGKCKEGRGERRVEEVTDEPLYRDRVCGIDIGKAQMVATIRVPSDRDPARRAACFERGAVTACFVATPEFRIIRLHTRYRRDLTEERTREKQRAEKLLESAAIKISAVLTDLHGVTGRDIMDRLIAGERNPKVLAQLARAAARRKISQLEQALEGAEFFTPAHV